MLRSKLAPLAIATVIAASVGCGALAFAESKEAGEHKDIAAVMNAKTSLTQAIAAAEAQASGKAVSAGIENHKGTAAYAVEVASGGKLQTVFVDPETGKVTKSTAATAKPKEDGDFDQD
jgi:uncharacterized iron-regulated membrane protein